MGKILPQYKKAIIDEVANSISSNTSQYYVFASNPVAQGETIPPIINDDYHTLFINDWQMLFGKKLTENDIIPVIDYNVWVSNTVYTSYNNTTANLSNYFVVTEPAIPGGNYQIFKCIDNANGAPSTEIPDQLQSRSFTKADGYTWRYIASVTDSNFTKFASASYIPVFPNNSIVAAAYDYSGVEKIVISNTGSGYNAYNSGYVRDVTNTTVVQIESGASTTQDYYTRNGIYFYNPLEPTTAQLKVITNYVSNLSGRFVYLDSELNTNNVVVDETQYIISPRVVFETDGNVQPEGYSVINSTSNAIVGVVITETGYGVTRANVSFDTNVNYGSGANAYCVVPPPGGHGSNPAVELNCKGYSIGVSFNDSESNTISTDVLYNKIGIIKNPYILTANGDQGTRYSNATFNAMLVANVSPEVIFTIGEEVIGQTSGAIGTVAYSNSSQIFLTGDKKFANNEFIANRDGSTTATIIINTLGDVYTKGMTPLYVENTTDVQRTAESSESFKLIVKV